MAKFSSNGLDELMKDIAAFEGGIDSLGDEILDEGGDILARAQQEEVRTLWAGPYSEGISPKSIKKGKITKTKDGKKIVVSPKGSRKRGKKTVRNAEIAFINEYGTRGQPGRPAIRTANLKAESSIGKAAEDILDKHQKNHGL